MIRSSDPVAGRSNPMRWRLMLVALAAASAGSCSAPPPQPPPSHPHGELYLSPREIVRPPPSTENDPNGGAS